MNTLKEEIHAYWTQRAEGYSEYNQQEMADARRSMWKNKLLSLLEENFPGKNPEELKVLDVGTGPGCPASCGGRISGNGSRRYRGDAERGKKEYRSVCGKNHLEAQ